MELKELLKTMKKHSKNLIFTGVFFGFLGLLFFYYFPKTYKAVGSFYVTRGVDLVERSDFRYEGYYAQQAGTNYAETLIGLLESVDVRSAALIESGVLTTEATLREAARNIKAKKTAPQLVTLSVKGRTLDLAESFWVALSQEAITASDRLNRSVGDSSLSISLVSDAPVVYEVFNNVYLDVFAGVFFGLLLGSFIAVLKEYLS